MTRGHLLLLIVTVVPITAGMHGCSPCGPAGPQPISSSYPPCNRCQASPSPGRLVPAPVIPGRPAPLPPGPVAPPPGVQPLAPTPSVPSSPPSAAPLGQDPPSASWKPSDPPSARLTPPDQGNPSKTPDNIKLYPPENHGPKTSPPLSVPPGSTPPGGQNNDPSPAVFPVDIPQFSLVKPQVACGQKPLPEGVTWLRDRGYRTIVHLIAVGEDDTAARRQFESKGFAYQSLEVSPQNLKPEVVARFSELVKDTRNQPLFIYDRDSSLAGGLWYLHFRLVDNLAQEKALEEAGRLGFKPTEEGAQQEMWKAVESFLRMKKASFVH